VALYQVGESGNLNGRPKGSRNKRTEEIFTRLEERGDKDPADLLSEIVSDPKESKELRVQAANFLLPYKYGKCGSIPAARYISEPVTLPKAVTLDQANQNIALISEMKAQGQIDLDFADSLIADNRTIANNLIAAEELKLKLELHHGGDHHIVITGGLPPLPGTNVKMPILPGTEHEINGTAIEQLSSSESSDHAPLEHEPHDPQSPDPSESHQ
jgi:hypothetical protein